MPRKLLLTCFSLVLGTSLYGQSLDMAARLTHDSQVKRVDIGMIADQSYSWDESGAITTKVQASVRQAHIERVSRDSSLAQLWDHRHQVVENGGSLGITQGLSSTYGVEASFGRSVSPINASQYYLLGAYLWLYDETIRLAIQSSQTNTRQKAIDTVDSDAFRILTPETVDGRSLTTSFLALASLTTIVEGQYTQITRSDRPKAWSGSASVRQYISPLDTAVHLRADYFENLGEIKPITLQGETIAKAGTAEWHQRLFDHFILMGGYRYYWETESPRANTLSQKNTGSDWLYGRLTYRFWKNVWSHPSDEIYLFGGDYRNSRALKASTWGMGAKWDFH